MNGDFNLPSVLDKIQSSLLKEKNIHLYFKRDDLISSDISGNKWRKLKYNIQAAKDHHILTFGGAFSNHIVATAIACNQHHKKSIGIIRGEEPSPLNYSLEMASKNGMQLHFVSREAYRKKNEAAFIEALAQEYKNPFILPEGGSNVEGMQGCKEIVDEIAIDFDYIISAVGTGCTIAGIASALKEDQKAIGISVLKGAAYLKDEIVNLLKMGHSDEKAQLISERIVLNHDYHFGGYAKIRDELITFIHDFYKEQGIKTDPIYSGKSLYALFDMIKKDAFKPGSTIVYYHCGGLQGVKGMEDRYHIKLFDNP